MRLTYADRAETALESKRDDTYRPQCPASGAGPGSRVMKRVRAAIAASAILAAGAALTGCGGAGGAASGTTITLYSGQHEQTTQSLVSAFEKKTGINVVVRSDDEDVLADQIDAEGSHSPADVFFTENSPPLESLQAKGLLAAVTPTTLASTPANLSSPQGDWVGVSARVSVLVYNPSLISPSQLPTHVSQLADPQYKGKLAIAPSETDFQPIVTAYQHAFGTAATLTWLKKIDANAAGHIYPDNETIANDVNRGAAAFGIINQYYWFRLQAEIGAGNMHSKIAFFAPHDPGYVLDVSGAAVLKSSKNQAAAQKFVAFLVSKQGQEIIATPGTGTGESLSFEYPIAAGVTRAGEPPFSQLRPYPITIEQLGDGSAAVALMRQAGLI
ncbi:MAG TPA: extracellular solute-binding protein [Streptosporangiaceae bacterium]|nr:extracellular solute-binding protein [Streptosporangiaceae bacterium]